MRLDLEGHMLQRYACRLNVVLVRSPYIPTAAAGRPADDGSVPPGGESDSRWTAVANGAALQDDHTPRVLFPGAVAR